MNLLAVIVIAAALLAFINGQSAFLLLQLQAVSAERLARYQSTAGRLAQIQLVGDLQAAETSAIAANTPYAQVGALASMPSTALCDVSADCGLSATATYTVDGETDNIGSANGPIVVAPNVEAVAGVSERRIAVTMSVTITEANGEIVHARPQRLAVRLWAPGNAEIVTSQDSAARANRVASGSGENAGCGVDASGCDSQAVQAADPTTLDGETQCTLGPGSGSCAPGETQPDAQKTAVPWVNPQAAPASGP